VIAAYKKTPAYIGGKPGTIRARNTQLN